jgi:hypothetical protein
LGVVAAALMLVFRAAEWRSDQVLLPRYCDDPDAHLERVRRILTESDPAGEESRRPYIIAAKLMFLVPQETGESVEHYLTRLRRRLDATCR